MLANKLIGISTAVAVSKELVLVSSGGGAGGSTVNTITSMAAGSASSDRILMAAILLSGSSSSSVSSVTIGGVTATRRAGRTAGDFVQADIWSAAVPTGTTATVVVTASTGSNGCSVYLYSAKGYNNANWVGGTDFQASNTSTALMDVVLTVPSAGGILAIYNGANIQSTATRVWTGATVDVNDAGADGTGTAVSGDIALTTTAKVVSATGGSTTISFNTSDTTRRRPAFAAVAFD